LAEAVFAEADIVVNVKEPMRSELSLLREEQFLFTYLHLAADKELTEGLMETGCVGIAYETVSNKFGHLPLLAPMSEVAGKMAIQVGPHHRKKEQGGSGVLLGGVTGIAATRVLIIGGDVSGINEVRMAMVMEAKVAVLDRSLGRFAELDMPFVGQVNVLLSTVDAIVFHVIDAGLVVGAVLVPVAAAPKLVIEDIVRTVRPGSEIVDIAID